MYVEHTPVQTGIEGVDLKAASTYTSELIDVREIFAYTIIVDVDITGAGSAGDAKLTVDIISGIDGETVLHTLDILTSIDTFTADTKEVLVFGGGLAAFNTGSGALDANADIIKIAGFLVLKLEVTTQSDSATSSLGSVTFFGVG